MPRLRLAPGFIVLASMPLLVSAETLDLAYETSVDPFLKSYCISCHGGEKTKADVDFTLFRNATDVKGEHLLWEAVLEMLQTHEMPPKEEELQPTLEERESILAWIKECLYTFDPANPDPGRVTIRRLNRAEYNNTIRDLVGVPFRPADDFPQDDAGYGFDTIGDVLSLPPILLERYLAAAEEIIDRAIVTEPPPTTVRRFPVNLLEVGFNALGDRGDGWAHLVSLEEDDVAIELPIVSPGDYRVRVLAYADPKGGVLGYESDPDKFKNDISSEPPMISFKLGDTFIAEFEVTTDPDNPQVYEARLGVPTGQQRFRAVVHRDRGGEGERYMKNGRLGKQQAGVVYVKWLEIEGPLPGVTRRIPARDLAPRGRHETLDNGHVLLPGDAAIEHTVSVDKESDVLIRAYAYADQAGDALARLELRLDGKPVRQFDVDAPAKMKPLPGQRVFSIALLDPMPKRYEAKVTLPPGRHTVSAAFVNDFEDPGNANPNLRDRNLYIQSLETVDLSTDWAPPPIPAPVERHFVQARAIEDPRQRARAILESFGSFAWRRPVTARESDRLLSLYDLAEQSGDAFNGRVKLAMKAILASPNFIYRRESQPSPDDPNQTHPIDEYALASRLSYFIWSSLPDDELREHARNGTLRGQLPAQVRRMLKSPKAAALIENFAGQWLQTRRMDAVRPDGELFANFNKQLGADMRTETEMLFAHVMRENRSVLDLLNADYTFLNERLARHYGIPGVEGDQFRKVSLADVPRRGVLSHGSVLTLTSNPNRTSPVKRGQWVLENLLGTPPPPPPPDVPELEEEGGEDGELSLREQMELHRAKPNCISCHERMDPIGFALENFDAVGSWRDMDAGDPIDASAQLPSGEAFSGAVELVEILATARREDYLTTIARKMLIYALGRGLEYYDRPAVDGVVDALEQNELRFESLVIGIAESVPFQLRRGEGQRGDAYTFHPAN